MTVVLIRHAKVETPSNIAPPPTADIVVDSDTRTKVSALRGTHRDIGKIYCSRLKRAMHTAQLLFPENSDITYLELINECKRPSRFDGKDRQALQEFWEIEHRDHKYDPIWKPEDGESYFECATRAEKFHKILQADKDQGNMNVTVIGHGMFFRHLACALTGVKWMKDPRVVIDLLRKFEWENLEAKRFVI